MKKSGLLRKIIDNSEKIAFYILCSWCVLPITMVFIDIYNYLAGNFPSRESLIEEGLDILWVIYPLSLSIYLKLFTIIGIVTIAYSLFCLLNKGKVIFSKNNFKDKPWFFFLMALIIWIFASSLFADDVSISFFGDGYYSNGFFSYLVYISIFVVSSVINNKGLRKKLILLFNTVITLLAILMFAQCFNIDFIDRCFPTYRATVFNNPNHLAFLLCMCAISYISLYLFDENKFNYLYLVGFAFILYILLINNAFGAYLGLLVSFIFTYILYKLRGNKFNLKTILPILIFIVLSLLCSFNLLPLCINNVLSNFTAMFSDIEDVVTKEGDYLKGGTNRIILWKKTLEVISYRPLFGVGGDGLNNEYALFENVNPHNEYLTYACFFGIPALILYLAALISLAINRFKNIKSLDTGIIIAATMIFAYLGSAFFGNIVFNTAPYFWIFLGMCSGVNHNEKPLFLPIHKEHEHKHEPRKLITIALTLVTIVLLLVLWINWSTEKTNERADLCAMKAAYSTAKFCYDYGSIELGEYWYNDDNFSLIPINEEKPLAYGLGNQSNAHYVNIFNKANSTEFDYDGKQDYTDKVVKVSLNKNNDNSLNISVVWQ